MFSIMISDYVTAKLLTLESLSLMYIYGIHIYIYISMYVYWQKQYFLINCYSNYKYIVHTCTVLKGEMLSENYICM